MTSVSLKKKLKAISNQMPETHSIRLHRAISWLKGAEDQEMIPDLRLICLWISINSLYAVDNLRATEIQERARFGSFVDKLVECDEGHRLYSILWHKFSGPVKMLIENQYVYAPFWDFQRGQARSWENSFQQSIVDANNALSDRNVKYLLRIVLDRLYVLRNQLIHGGATYKSKINRAQVRDGGNLLGVLLPIIIELMMISWQEDWGQIYFPVIK